MRAPLPPSSDVRTTSGPPPANRGRVLLEDHLDLIQRKLRRLSRHSGLPDCEAEDFRSWALLKLIDDDYRILVKWEGRSSFSAFLTVVFTNLLRDYRTHLWGKWRPCAASRRRGREVVLLEQLLVRDGLSIEEAVERLRTRHGVSFPPAEVARLAAAFPRREERRQVSESELLQIPVDGQVESRIEERERACIAGSLCDLLAQLFPSLPAEDRLILKLYYFDDLSMAAISPIVGRPARELFQVRDRCLKKIRRSLDEGGLGLKQVRELFGHFQGSFDMKALLVG
jgi:RNA polymerase sigma factor (sigma-70 family)